MCVCESWNFLRRKWPQKEREMERRDNEFFFFVFLRCCWLQSQSLTFLRHYGLLLLISFFILDDALLHISNSLRNIYFFSIVMYSQFKAHHSSIHPHPWLHSGSFKSKQCYEAGWLASSHAKQLAWLETPSVRLNLRWRERERLFFFKKISFFF